MHKVGAVTGGPHAQIKFLKREIKQKRFRSSFEIKNWHKIDWLLYEGTLVFNRLIQFLVIWLI